MKFGVNFWQNWRELFGKDYNWKNFTLIVCEFERDISLDRYKLWLGLIGFHVEFDLYSDLESTEMGRTILERKKVVEDKLSGLNN